MQYHPDRNKAPGAEERFKEIAEAYAVLSDPKKRAEYDSAGFAGVAGFTPEDLFGGIDFDSIFGDLGFGLGGGLFDRFFGRRRAGPPRGADIEVEVRVPLEVIASGGEETIRIERRAACTACGGSGQKTTSRRDRGVLIRQSTPCSECGGSGRGRVQREESIAVRIPVGAEDGLVLRVPGKGYAAAAPGGTAGDLLVVVRSAPDPRFGRSGADLWRVEELDIADAVLGAEIRVPTLAGNVAVQVPPGTQPDSQLRLRGKGLPRYGGRGRGDLYVRLALRVPARLSAEEKRLYERLRAIATTSRKA